MILEIEWETRPKSGLTEIDIKDLGCKNKKEFDLLSTAEKSKRISSYLLDSELGTVKFTATNIDDL